MAEDRLHNARTDARAAVDAYDSLDRDQRMDVDVLRKHAGTLQGELTKLVKAADGHFGSDAPEEIGARRDAARQAIEEFAGVEELEAAQHVRRACFVLRKEADTLLKELEEVGA